MELLNEYLTATDALVVYIVYSSMVQALWEPKLESPPWYRFIYRFLNALGANWKQAKNGS